MLHTPKITGVLLSTPQIWLSSENSCSCVSMYLISNLGLTESLVRFTTLEHSTLQHVMCPLRAMYFSFPVELSGYFYNVPLNEAVTVYTHCKDPFVWKIPQSLSPHATLHKCEEVRLQYKAACLKKTQL